MQKIKLSDVRQQMNETRMTPGGQEPLPFCMVFITCDEERGTGGEFRELIDAQLVTTSTAVANGTATKPASDEIKVSSPYVKVRDNQENRIINVHWRLITQFNKQEVVW